MISTLAVYSVVVSDLCYPEHRIAMLFLLLESDRLTKMFENTSSDFAFYYLKNTFFEHMYPRTVSHIHFDRSFSDIKTEKKFHKKKIACPISVICIMLEYIILLDFLIDCADI